MHENQKASFNLLVNYLHHTSATAGPRAECNPLHLLIWPGSIKLIKLMSYDFRKTHHVFSHQGLFCDSSKFGYRFKMLCNKFKRGSVSNKWWSADHGLLATDTLASLVDTLALITQRISFLKGGRAAGTVNVSEFQRDILCLCSK
jgi:hypothetical protein